MKKFFLVMIIGITGSVIAQWDQFSIDQKEHFIETSDNEIDTTVKYATKKQKKPTCCSSEMCNELHPQLPNCS